MLDDYSSSVASELFADFPEWQEFAREENYENGAGYLVIEVPAPIVSQASEGISIMTYNTEVTVSFDYYHSHFETWRSTQPDNDFWSAFPFIRDLINDSIAVASWWNGDQLLGACEARNGQLPDKWRPQEYTLIRVRSWNGTHSEDRPFIK